MPPKPLHAIRCFDIFAAYRKQEQEDDGLPTDEAKGYGLRVIKVVAARRFGRTAVDHGLFDHAGRAQPAQPERAGKWHVLSGELQTAALFDQEIVERLGEAGESTPQ